jgi:K+-sensing histidine kinase KdpD
MARVGWKTRHRGLILGTAVLAPLLASALMSTLRNSLENTNAALVLVLWVVPAASTGIRLAGVLAALSSAAWFDFFLTAPYLTFRINDRADIETPVLLVLVGAAVIETRIGAEGSKRRRVVVRAFWLASSKQRR